MPQGAKLNANIAFWSINFFFAFRFVLRGDLILSLICTLNTFQRKSSLVYLSFSAHHKWAKNNTHQIIDSFMKSNGGTQMRANCRKKNISFYYYGPMRITYGNRTRNKNHFNIHSIDKHDKKKNFFFSLFKTINYAMKLVHFLSKLQSLF